MCALFLTDLFTNRIELLCKNDKSLSSAYKKVRGKINGYAKCINVPISELQILHISDDSGNLQKKLVQYIKSVSSKKKKYQGEILSILRRLVAKIFSEVVTKTASNKKAATKSLSVADLQAPSWMNPILDLLVRQQEKNKYLRNDSAAYQQRPLTENSIIFFEALLKVVKQFNPLTLESLLTDYRPQIYLELKKLCSPVKLRALQTYTLKIRNKLGIFEPSKSVIHLPANCWSPQFQSQWEKYEELAEQGIPDGSSLARHALYYNVSVKAARKITIAKNKSSLSIGLYHCLPLPDDWKIEDLLSLKTRKITIAGQERQEFYNEFVEKYRIREQNRATNSKRIGFDSRSFFSFKTALNAVAAFNGHFHLIEPFNNAYQLKLDKDSTKLRKDHKKRQYSLSQVDSQIAELEVEFNKIVKNKSFMRRPGITIPDADRAMRFCTFYMILLVFRFLGVRQRNVRNFRLMQNPENAEYPDGNIGFRKDGTVVIHYEPDEIKTKRRLHLEFNLHEHNNTHGLLIRGLTTYFKKIYPYINKNTPLTFENQFFAQRSLQGKFIRLPEKASNFSRLFMYWSETFLKFEHHKGEKYSPLNPHFFRGLCTDWLVKVLHFTLDQAAEYIGIDPMTLKSEYLDRNRTYDATTFVTDKNRKIRLNTKLKEEFKNQHRLEEENKFEIARRDKQFNELTKQLDKLQSRLDEDELDKANLRAQLIVKDNLIQELLIEQKRLNQLLNSDETP